MGMSALHYVAACGRHMTCEPPSCSPTIAVSITRLLLRSGAKKYPKDKVRALVCMCMCNEVYAHVWQGVGTNLYVYVCKYVYV
jgi:hypothetical protein